MEVVAGVEPDAGELASGKAAVGELASDGAAAVGCSRHMTMQSRPLEAATDRLPRFTASSA